jgi:hypothetical protein
MPTLPAGVLRQTEIAQAVAEVERLLAPDVVRIRYEVTTDWQEEWSVYFRVVLSDEAFSIKRKLGEILDRVRQELDKRVDFDALGLLRYHKFRSVSDQAHLREEAWA